MKTASDWWASTLVNSGEKEGRMRSTAFDISSEKIERLEVRWA